ncbi:putative ABC transporter, permease protein [Longispora fulva]|nr:putative ABC transporter, permease protein [Longispora fulva]
MSWPLRVLLVNQFGVNVGFYLLVPFLAGYLDGLGLAATAVGLVLGVRTLSQQGLFLLGGTLADRWGPRPVIIVGCALRTVGFGLFAVLDNLPGLLAAAVLSGLSGALFNPAVRAYVAVEAGDGRAEAFARFAVFANAGALAGPLLGAALIGVGFPVVAGGAAGIFAALTVAQVFALPARSVARRPESVWRDWRGVLGHREFLGFTVAASGVFALYTQLYLVIPLAAERATGTPRAVGGVFLLATVLSLALQVPITAWCREHWSPGHAVAVGLALMGAAFLPPLAAQRGPVGVGAVTVSVLLLSLGYAVANPFVMDLVAGLGDRDLPGTQFGVFYLVSGLIAAGASAGAGALWQTGWAWGPLALLGVGCAVAVAGLDRAGALVTATVSGSSR